MSNYIIFHKDYGGSEVTIYLDEDIITLHDSYNDYLTKFKIENVNKYIGLCSELQDYQEYDKECDEYYAPYEIDTSDYDDEFLLEGNYIVHWRIEYYIDAIEKSDIGNIYNIGDVTKLSKEKLESYNILMLEYILNKVKDKKELKQARPAC